MYTLWANRYALRTQRIRSSIIRELLKLTEKPDVISFAGGLPAPDVFPVEEFQAAAARVLEEHGSTALQYSTTEGYRPLREMIARHTARYGIVVKPENVLITNGSQQALDLLGRIFINPGDRILVERPTYIGALGAWNAYQAEYVGVPLDEEGLRTDLLEGALRVGPKFIYALPNFQNPTGVTLSLARRRELISLASRSGVPIIEDDPYGQLRYEGDHLPPLVVLEGKLRATDSDGCYSGNVIYLSTFSKTLAPGPRLGWVIAPVDVIEKLVQAKQGADLHTSTFTQMVAYEVAHGGFLDQHVRKIRAIYRKRRDAMLAALERYFPEGVEWTHPNGGLFLWVILPESLAAEQVLEVALEEEKVAFIPGGPFFPPEEETQVMENTMRLNFSNASLGKIEEGIARLGRVLERVLERSSLPV